MNPFFINYLDTVFRLNYVIFLFLQNRLQRKGEREKQLDSFVTNFYLANFFRIDSRKMGKEEIPIYSCFLDYFQPPSKIPSFTLRFPTSLFHLKQQIKKEKKKKKRA